MISPAFDQPLGLALGAADFVFLAFFAAIARHPSLRFVPILALCRTATFDAMLVGPLLETYLLPSSRS